MRLQGEYTPREAAHDIAIGWLRHAYLDVTNDLNYYAKTPAQKRELKNAIAKLHNRLLSESKLDGMALNEDN